MRFRTLTIKCQIPRRLHLFTLPQKILTDGCSKDRRNIEVMSPNYPPRNNILATNKVCNIGKD